MSDEAVTDPMFVELFYLQMQADYMHWHFPVGKDDAVLLAALQIFVEIGFLVPDWTLLLHRFLPKQIAMTREKWEWEMDILSHSRSMKNLSKDDARQQFSGFLKALPYGYSVFYSVRKINDPIDLLPDIIDLGINKRGLHFFCPVPNKYLISVELRDIQWHEATETDVTIAMRVDGVVNEFKFETKQGEDICFALLRHINDAMLEKHSKAALEDSVKKANQPNQEALLQELECLKDSLRSEKQKVADAFEELKARTSEIETLQKNVADKDAELLTLKNSLREMEESKKDIDRKNEQTASILKMLGAEIEKTLQRGSNVSLEEVARLKKLLAHWEEQAG